MKLFLRLLLIVLSLNVGLRQGFGEDKLPAETQKAIEQLETADDQALSALKTILNPLGEAIGSDAEERAYEALGTFNHITFEIERHKVHPLLASSVADLMMGIYIDKMLGSPIPSVYTWAERLLADAKPPGGTSLEYILEYKILKRLSGPHLKRMFAAVGLMAREALVSGNKDLHTKAVDAILDRMERQDDATVHAGVLGLLASDSMLGFESITRLVESLQKPLATTSERALTLIGTDDEIAERFDRSGDIPAKTMVLNTITRMRPGIKSTIAHHVMNVIESTLRAPAPSPSAPTAEPEISGDSFNLLKLLPNGNIELRFTLGEMSGVHNFTLIDDDGAATFVTLLYLLIQAPSEEIYFQRTTWAAVKSKRVDHWQAARPFMAFALKKLQQLYEDAGRGNPGAFLQNREILLLRERFDALPAQPTYEQIEVLGRWAQEEAKKHFYDNENLIDGSHALAVALRGRSLQLSLNQTHRSKSVLAFDFEKSLPSPTKIDYFFQVDGASFDHYLYIESSRFEYDRDRRAFFGHSRKMNEMRITSFEQFRGSGARFELEGKIDVKIGRESSSIEIPGHGTFALKPALATPELMTSLGLDPKVCGDVL